MKNLASAVLVAVVLAAGGGVVASFAQSAEPYKLGMFRQNDREFVGLVVRDALVLDLSRAGVATPSLKDLITRWDAAMAERLGKLAADAARQAPAGALKLDQLKTLPPIPDPVAMLNAAVNYQEHAAEMSRAGALPAQTTVDPKVAQGIPGMWTRKPGDTRHNPYFFPKLRSAITGHGDPIVLPRNRDQVDWECELSVVIGRTAKNVTADRAAEYVFGYTLMNDVSDRGGRADGRHGSDWLIGKSHDTFAPLGPFVVPRAFVPDPQKLAVKFTLNDKVMQDSSTDRMTHTVFELVEFASHIVTLRPGDIIAAGSPAGVGTARSTPIYMKDGDRSSCTIESIGTLANPVQAERAGTNQ